MRRISSNNGVQATSDPKGTEAAPEGEIVTAKVVEMNSAKYGRPPIEFRLGAVSPIESPKAVKTATGFQVQFASHATITTPTVYEHEILVSGGFESKELYAKSSGAQDSANGFSGGAPAAAAPSLAMKNIGVSNVSSMQGFQGSSSSAIATSTPWATRSSPPTPTGKTLWSYKLAGDTKTQGGFLGTTPLAAKQQRHGRHPRRQRRADRSEGRQGARPLSDRRPDPVATYVGTEDGKLVAIDTKDATVTGWPTWGGNAQCTGIAR